MVKRENVKAILWSTDIVLCSFRIEGRFVQIFPICDLSRCVINWTRFPQDIYRTHSGWDEFLERGHSGQALFFRTGEKRKCHCTVITFSPRKDFLSNHFLLLSLLDHYAVFPILCCNLKWCTHSRSMDRQIMQSCKSLFSAPPSRYSWPSCINCTLKPPYYGVKVFPFTWPLLLQESCPRPEKNAQVIIINRLKSILLFFRKYI